MLNKAVFAVLVKKVLRYALIRLPTPLKGGNFVSTNRNSMKTASQISNNNKKQFLLSAIIMINSALCVSQSNVIGTIVEETKEKNFVATPALGNVEPTLFEANLNIHRLMPVRNTRFAVDLSYKMVLRMLHTKSSPINTPSYRPSVTIYSLLKQNADSSNILGSLSFNHHSNGQDNSFYTSDGSVNVVNGNFSTNYIQAGLIKQSNKKGSSKYYSIAWEQHLNIDRSTELNDCYGFSRLHLNYQSEAKDLSKIIRTIKEKNFVQINVNNEWIFGKMCGAKTTDINKRMITSALLTYKPACVNGFSFFAQYYRGQDYYNINFVNSLSFVRFGVNIEPTGLYKSLKS